MDVVTLSAKVNAISYVLYLIGPPASFTGVGLPDPAVLEDFWTQGVLRVTNEPLSFQVLLSAAVSDTNVLAVPTNVALASAGAVASASSTYGAGYPVAAVNNNERAGANSGNGGDWADATPNACRIRCRSSSTAARPSIGWWSIRCRTTTATRSSPPTP